MRAAAGSSPIYAVINAVHKYLSFTHALITMTSLQPLKLRVLPDRYPIATYKTYCWIVLASFPGHACWRRKWLENKATAMPCGVF